MLWCLCIFVGPKGALIELVDSVRCALGILPSAVLASQIFRSPVPAIHVLQTDMPVLGLVIAEGTGPCCHHLASGNVVNVLLADHV